MAAKSGGPDPSGNPALRLVMDKARAANMPKDNIQRAIKKAEGGSDEHYDEITYEGYAPGGVAVLVEALMTTKIEQLLVYVLPLLVMVVVWVQLVQLPTCLTVKVIL